MRPSATEPGPKPADLADPRMFLAVVATGAAAGVAGGLLTLLLHLTQHIAFGYTEDTFLIGVERARPIRRVLAMAIGGLIVGVGWWQYSRYVERDAASVTHALRTPPHRLPFVPTTIDAMLQIVAVGIGSSLGREGAPRQLGAACAAWLGERLRMDVAQRRLLLACGAGAGLAAVYNVPLGGAAFTCEVLLASIGLLDVVSALLASAIATAVAWTVLGNHATYAVPHLPLRAPLLLWAVLAAPLIGLAGVGFSALMAFARRLAPAGRWLPISVPLVFAAIGALAIPYPELLGNGKGLAQLSFAGSLTLATGAALTFLKPLASAGSLASGAIGGLLTPSLATGAALGIFLGRVWDLIWPGAPIASYAIVGAAALLAVTQRAPVTALLLTLEFIGSGLNLVVPMAACVGIALVSADLTRRIGPRLRVGSGPRSP